jgi:GxxExxY protein
MCTVNSGPDCSKSVYETCLGLELNQSGIPFKRQAPIPVVYRSLRLNTGFRADFLICDDLIVEIKAVERLLPTHEAQLLTYLRMSGCQVGLLLNFNAVRLKDGLRRVVRTRQVEPP